jgi:uncharacterized phage protein (TIGR02220 family)
MSDQQEKKTAQDFLVSDDMWIYDFSLIDKGIMYCKEINDSEFRTYCVIRSLVNHRKQVAYPSVETIADLCGHSDRTARRNIARLESLDLISRIQRKGTSNYYMVKKLQNSKVLANPDDILEWMESHPQPEPEKKKPADPKPQEEPKDHIPYKQIMDYLNEMAGTKFSHTGSANQKLIKARWNEMVKGKMETPAILDSFKHVIDVKTAQWKGSDMDQYLRPSTLFGNKFDQYRNEQADRKMPVVQTGQAPQSDRFKKFLEGDE